MNKCLVWLCAIITGLAAAQESVDMKLQPQDAMKQFRGYMPQRIDLSDKQPASVTKLPPDLKSPQFGTMPFRLASGETDVAVVMDAGKDQIPGLYVDANGNGDLTDDSPVAWKAKSKTLYMADVPLSIGENDHATDVKLVFYHFHDDPSRAQLANVIFYYADYGLFGTITLAGKSYKVGLNDTLSTGDFRGKADGSARGSGILLLIDTNGSGKLTRTPGTSFDVQKPFNIGGITYEVHDMTADGKFSIIKSAKSVAEITPPPNLEVGQSAPAFTAKTMDGKTVHFPDDYKGHVIMLDFWATWCGPCMGEVPGLATAYEKYHPRGFEVLGISLDNPDSTDKINSVLKENKMLWPEVYDGKGWKAAVAEQYGIQSIPSPILVDGDTGKILASLGDLRGGSLDATLEKVLANHSK